jgi:L-aspartate oxidase
MRRVETDFIVVGSGIAGLTAALHLRNAGRVTILTKAQQEESNSFRAQGGIAAAIGENDSPTLHREDTLRTGVELCDLVSVDLMVEMAPKTIEQLVEWGTRFDQENGHYALGREGSHSVSRILHVGGDATGAGITSSLLREARQSEQIEIVTHTMVYELVLSQGICQGVVTVAADQRPTVYLARKGVVLATGGCGQLYLYTTNDLVVTGDGFAIAKRAGAKLSDMEFIQFHPTALAVDQNPMFLISEAVRGEGAILRNSSGEAFMSRYHEWKDLAPRDVVSRAIYHEMSQGKKVYLDATNLGTRFADRFPKIYHGCLKNGIDPTIDWIPVTPAAHFIMGGIQTDLDGQTTVPRLFACGEVARTGVHGANRLASNSLLEGAVFAQRVAEKLSTLEPQSFDSVIEIKYPDMCIDKQRESEWKKKLRQIMWEHAGIIRTSSGLIEGIKRLKELTEEVPESYFEVHNMLLTAQIIMESALWRQESRGGHYRFDYPETIPEWATKHYEV